MVSEINQVEKDKNSMKQNKQANLQMQTTE